MPVQILPSKLPGLSLPCIAAPLANYRIPPPPPNCWETAGETRGAWGASTRGNAGSCSGGGDCQAEC